LQGEDVAASSAGFWASEFLAKAGVASATALTTEPAKITVAIRIVRLSF
jgi:hypothetical protein